MGPHTSNEARILLQRPLFVLSVSRRYDQRVGTSGGQHFRPTDRDRRYRSPEGGVLFADTMPKRLAVVQGVPGRVLYRTACDGSGKGAFWGTSPPFLAVVCS